jgi:hypothetical protein
MTLGPGCQLVSFHRNPPGYVMHVARKSATGIGVVLVWNKFPSTAHARDLGVTLIVDAKPKVLKTTAGEYRCAATGDLRPN